ncbi:DUF5802 family protein [Natranaeroarchaeum sulfidigenes]|uniref:Uncharacterized protein n=1 Tax=Natranaeroarchaeum sulfidigenes TaxID=2784880 RepID=A0A897MRV6_9EURY|nr:DUF5802 family protein [Natranaeroarchaeum sulfidigenes]QSG03294.1 Uncharacterized protein AArcS_2094 [Natranaeroarchaeum sulfidigenes]
MFEEFSSGYYFGRLYVEPFDGDRAVMQREQHEQVNEELYATGDGVERLDAPLVMKLDRQHFSVHGDSGIPPDTIAVPESIIDGAGIENPPTLSEVFLAKRDHARKLLGMFGQPSARTDTPDGGSTSGR